MLLGSLSSVMVTTLVTDGTAAFNMAATADASRAAAMVAVAAVLVADGGELAVADVDTDELETDGDAAVWSAAEPQPVTAKDTRNRGTAARARFVMALNVPAKGTNECKCLVWGHA